MRRRTKIVATLGPASSNALQIEEMIKAGMNVARINMSHADHQTHRKTIATIREVSKKINRHVAILVDLQGPKIRVDKLKSPLTLQDGERWTIAHGAAAKGEKIIPTVYKNLVQDAQIGENILFDDGLIVAKALKKTEQGLEIEVLTGGILNSNKGINLPGSAISAPSLTEKDEKDLLFALKNEVDYIALSFVRSSEDVRKVKILLHKWQADLPIIAKIEKPEAVENITEIIKETDAVMVARGDLAVEVGAHLVPSLQKKIIRLCNDAGKPVITATQMLDSMIHNPTPTRAEATDVANAIWDGTDAVMLSGESAAGQYPVLAVKTMNKIVVEAEKTPRERPLLRHTPIHSVSAASQVAASIIAEKIHSKWVVSITQTGNSCLKMSRFRPRMNILGVTRSLRVMRKMCLYWGITPFYFPIEGVAKEETETFLEYKMIDFIKEKRLVKNGDLIVITRGDGEFFTRKTSNSIRVEHIRDIPVAKREGDDFFQVETKKAKIILDPNMCSGCQVCIDVCPVDIWKTNEQGKTCIDENQATQCVLDLKCVKECPTGAIEIQSYS